MLLLVLDPEIARLAFLPQQDQSAAIPHKPVFHIAFMQSFGQKQTEMCAAQREPAVVPESGNAIVALGLAAGFPIVAGLHDDVWCEVECDLIHAIGQQVIDGGHFKRVSAFLYLEEKCLRECDICNADTVARWGVPVETLLR